MDVTERDFLQKVSPLLFDSFEPIDLLPYFLVNELITDQDAKRIRAEKERRFRVADLLNLMQKNFPSLEPILVGLSQNGYAQLANELRHGFNSLPYSTLRHANKGYLPAGFDRLAAGIARRNSLHYGGGSGGGGPPALGYHHPHHHPHYGGGGLALGGGGSGGLASASLRSSLRSASGSSNNTTALTTTTTPPAPAAAAAIAATNNNNDGEPGSGASSGGGGGGGVVSTVTAAGAGGSDRGGDLTINEEQQHHQSRPPAGTIQALPQQQPQQHHHQHSAGSIINNNNNNGMMGPISGGGSGWGGGIIPADPPASGLSPLSGNTKRLRQFFEATVAGVPHPNDLEFLLVSTTFTERQIVDWFREFAKACPNGRLSKSQFLKFYKYIDPNEPYSERFCEHVFRVFDRDRSGFIDFKEFLIALNIKLNGTPRERLEWTFRMYDIDGNGFIDIHEMTQITLILFDMLGREDDFPGQNPTFAARHVAELVFAKMDLARTGRISMDQFIDGCIGDPTVFSLLTTSFFGA